jgi:muramoyltetrapeptide carboxypeptidase
VDVLTEHLSTWGVPVLGGLPIGHGKDQLTVPLGVPALLDPDVGILTAGSAVR